MSICLTPQRYIKDFKLEKKKDFKLVKKCLKEEKSWGSSCPSFQETAHFFSKLNREITYQKDLMPLGL